MTGLGSSMGRVWTVLWVTAALLLVGCAQASKPGGPRPSTVAKPAAPAAKAAEAVRSEVPIDVEVEVAVDQAVLDADVRKAREFEALVARAESGDDDAAFELAERYRHGRDVAAHPGEAKRWYLRAAAAGHDRARELLVASYIRDTLYGYEPKPDFAHLLPWIKDAARGGNVIAQQLLARKYARGEDVPRDYYEARRWLQPLAERGDGGAQFSLAVMFHQGLGVEPDPKTAYRWFEAAAKQGDARSQYMLALLRYYGRGVAQDLGEARRWADLAAKQDDGDLRVQALTLLGTVNALVAAAPKLPPPPPEATPVPAPGAAAAQSPPAAANPPSGPPPEQRGR